MSKFKTQRIVLPKEFRVKQDLNQEPPMGVISVLKHITRTTSFDEPEASHFGTEKKEYLDSGFHVSFLESCENLPDLQELEVPLKDESSDTEPTAITYFRALNEKEKTRTSKNGKFDRVEVASSNSDSE